MARTIRAVMFSSLFLACGGDRSQAPSAMMEGSKPGDLGVSSAGSSARPATTEPASNVSGGSSASAPRASGQGSQAGQAGQAGQTGQTAMSKPAADNEDAGAPDAMTDDGRDYPNASGPTTKVSTPGNYHGYSEPMYAGFKITSQYVEVRDGTKLAIDIYRPLDKSGQVVETPLPVVWMHTPYSRATPIDGDELSMAEIYPGQAGALIKYGYVVAIADFRGLYASYGRNVGYNRGEWVEAARMDAYDITEWLAEQPWSTGKIGMWGCSATGGSQLQAATTAPPHLTAVFPMSCEFDAYPFGVAGGMAPEQGPTRAPPSTTDQLTRNLLAKPVDDDRSWRQLEEAITSHGEPLDNLGYMPFRDSLAIDLSIPWWLVSSPHTYLEQLNSSNTAFYVAANWDETYTKYGAFFTYNNLKRPVKLLVGPAGHCAWSAIPLQDETAVTVIGETGFDIRIEEHRYFDYWLKGIDNGIGNEPPVYYYTYGAPKGKEWSSARSWPPPESTRVSYFLREKLLDTQTSTEITAKDDFVVSYDATAANAAEHGLVYETPALEQAMQVTGHAVVDLWLASTARDSDVVAYIQNVAPDGSTTSFSMNGRLRASLRKEATAPYNNLELPWHPFKAADVEPLVPGEPAELRFDVLPFSMIFEKGHKLRLVLTFADAATPKLSPIPTVSVYRDASHPSSLTLPIIKSSAP